MKSNNTSIFSSFLLAFGLSMTVFPGDAAAQTFCQENGHGANGCSTIFGSGGYCWASSTSTTGYICKEGDPNAEILPSDHEAMASYDPILVNPAEPGGDPGEIQAAEIVICGPEGGAGCFVFTVADVCCDDLGLVYREPMSVGGATITCYD